MSFVWKQLDEWLSSNAPEAYLSLNPPATEGQIAAAEERMGLSFPASLRGTYLAHDGESDDSAGLFNSWMLLPLLRVVEHWEEFVQLEEDDPGGWGDGDFSAKTSIPVMWFEGEIRYVTTSGPTAGAVYELPRHGKPVLLAPSFDCFLENTYRQCVDGSLIVEPDFGYNLVLAAGA
ncbi:SMI1/KNR4 family protein [Lysobacter sp. Root916]|uniref:SMI1/KNR4 family protein n=1 Tax=Lysobacter sp. Root916 TaxID=1736606 RepID=UPI0009E82B18|nr:SMI1/KNR4 family protein [Lysobacter sp. Root916]